MFFLLYIISSCVFFREKHANNMNTIGTQKHLLLSFSPWRCRARRCCRGDRGGRRLLLRILLNPPSGLKKASHMEYRVCGPQPDG